MARLLEIKNLEISFKTFFGEVEAVRNVSFGVDRGETLAIVGESGCGKSVTASSIIKLLPEPPAYYKNGSIMFDGRDIVPMKESEIRKLRGKEIAMVFQDPMTSLNPTMRVGDQIIEGLVKCQNVPRKEAYEKAIRILDLVSVPEPERRMKQYPHEFSGGMRQRVMIALAMIGKPKLLIADEPTTALDVTVQAQIMDLMKRLKNEFDTAIILITHDLGVVADMADHIIVMYAGQIVERGTVDEIFENPKHPYTQKLLLSVPRPDMPKSKRLYSIQGTPPDLYIPPKGCSFYDRCDEAMKICENRFPDLEAHSDSHFSRCWLNHTMAIARNNTNLGNKEK